MYTKLLNGRTVYFENVTQKPFS